MTTTLHLVSPSPDDTRKLAAVLAGMLRPGDVVGLTGELGAGKTLFVAAEAAALGVTERVTSPSFLLRRDYPGPVPIVHFDVYRLDTLSEVLDLGYDEALDREHITFIEWSDAMAPLLPDDYLEVELRLPPLSGALSDVGGDDGIEPRRLTLRGHGRGWAARLADGTADLQPWRTPDAGGP